jgi:hypothetical protein
VLAIAAASVSINAQIAHAEKSITKRKPGAKLHCLKASARTLSCQAQRRRRGRGAGVHRPAPAAHYNLSACNKAGIERRGRLLPARSPGAERAAACGAGASHADPPEGSKAGRWGRGARSVTHLAVAFAAGRLCRRPRCGHVALRNTRTHAFSQVHQVPGPCRKGSRCAQRPGSGAPAVPSRATRFCAVSDTVCQPGGSAGQLFVAHGILHTRH